MEDGKGRFAVSGTFRTVAVRTATYFTVHFTEADFTPLALAVKVNVPALSVVATMAVSWPLKRCIRGSWKRSRQVASPLAAAL